MIVHAFCKAATSLTPQDVEENLFILRPVSDVERALRFVDDILRDFYEGPLVPVNGQ